MKSHTKKLTGFCVASSLYLTISSVSAVPVIYFGEDLTPGYTIPAGGAAETARNDFFINLSGVGTETFDSFTAGETGPFNLSFPGSSSSITATLSGGGSTICNTNINCLPPAAGEYPTSGDQWLATNTGFTINFSEAISTFGFYGTDIGDFGGQLELTLSNGSTEILTINNGSENGSLLFFGFIDQTNTYTSIAFSNSSGGSDFFGFDDMVIGDAGQINGGEIEIPEPGTLSLLVIGLLGFLGRKYFG